MSIRKQGEGVRRLLAGIAVATVALLPSDVALAMSVDEVVTRFEGCGFQIGEPETVRAVDGRPTTFFRVWHDHPELGSRGLVVYVYSDADAADGVFHALAIVDKLEGIHPDPSADNGPLIERGAGRSVWRENVAVAQIMPLTSPSDLDALPDVDLVRCLDST